MRHDALKCRYFLDYWSSPAKTCIAFASNSLLQSDTAASHCALHLRKKVPGRSVLAYKNGQIHQIKAMLSQKRKKKVML